MGAACTQPGKLFILQKALLINYNGRSLHWDRPFLFGVEIMDRKLVSKIDLEELRSAFAIAEEILEHDLAVIRISLIRDVHYDSLDLYVTVFGKENDEEDEKQKQ